MARLMSQVKGGYYAAAPEAVAAVLERLRPPDQGECLILDPCAGEGKALLQLAEGLKAVPYGIELSEDRAAMVRESLPEGQALAPADFLRCAISYRSFSFIWCNPPYDYATGEEGRVESQFIERAVHLLADDGVLALVCPEDVASSYQTVDFFQERFYEISAMPFPEEVRKYNETDHPGLQAEAAEHRSITAGIAGIGWRSGWRPASSTGCLRASGPGSFASRSRPIPNWRGWWHRVPLRFHIQRPADKAELSPPAADEPGHRPSGHAVGQRAYRRADLPGG